MIISSEFGVLAISYGNAARTREATQRSMPYGHAARTELVGSG